jgi:hypothetical protein
MRSQRACGRLRHSAVYVGCALRDRLAPLPGRGEPGSEWRTAQQSAYMKLQLVPGLESESLQ